MQRNNLFKKGLALFLSLIMTTLVPFSTHVLAIDDNTSSMTPIDGYQEMARKDKLALLANMEDGSFILQNLESGKLWYSSPQDTDSDFYSSNGAKLAVRSQLVITYVNKVEQNSNAKEYFANSFECVANGGLKVEEIENGIKVFYKFETQGIEIPVKYTLGDNYLNTTIDISGITQKGDCILSKINLLPGFGTGNWNDNGYIFVPDGSGALINFNNNSPDVYEQMVYGDELSVEKELNSNVSETIRLPVFGVASGKDALMGVITEGDSSASVVAYSGSETRGYNSVSSLVTLKITSSKIMFAKNWFNRQTVYRLSPAKGGVNSYIVRYYPLSGDEANYTGMAKSYRQYLINEKGLKKKVLTPTFNVDIVGSIDIKANFLGFTYYKNTALTTYKQAEIMLGALKSAGIEKLSARYTGWGNDGVSNRKIITSAKPMNLLGGKKGFTELNTYATKHGVTLFPDVDLTTYRNGSTKYATQTPFNETAFQYAYMPSVYATRLDVIPWRLITPTKINELGEKYLTSFKKLGIKTISTRTLTNTIYSDLKVKDGTYRSEMPRLVSTLLNKYTTSGLTVAGDKANAYVLPIMMKIYNAPSYASSFNMLDEEIPFYQLVLHGYVQLTTPAQVQASNPTANFLKAVETGSELLWTGISADSSVVTDTAYDNLYSSNYKLWIEDAKTKYIAYQPLLEKIYKQTIVSHRTLTNNVMETKFENGVTVVVNYNKTDITIDGLTIKAQSFMERKS